MKNKLPNKAFTLIELLVVIGLLTILLSIVLIAINPNRQFTQARDTQRRSDVNALLNAVHQYAADHNGYVPIGISTTEQYIASSAADLCSALIPTYIANLPTDPSFSAVTSCSGAYNSGYYISRDGTSGRITVSSPFAELGTISYTR